MLAAGWPFARRDPIQRRRYQKKNAGTHQAFRRLNYAFLILVRKGDAKSRHSEILMVAAVTRSQLQRLVDDGGLGNLSSEDRNGTIALLCNQVNLILMIFLSKNKVPGEVGH